MAKHQFSWPCLILISLQKQLALHLKIGVHKRNTVYDFDTIWAVQAAIIVQLDTLFYYNYTLACVANTVWLRAESERELPRYDTQTLNLLLTRHAIIQTDTCIIHESDVMF